MKNLFVATNNPDKLDEISSILKDAGLEYGLLSPKDFPDCGQPEEDGFSFEENALLKANYYYKLFHYPTIADDSGLSIDYLGGLPGVHSSRFMSDKDYPERNEFLISLLNGVRNRNASFIAAIAYIDKAGVNKTYLGILNGEIANKQEGDNGFGYDPIFYLPEYCCTTAQLPEEVKNKLSHRYLGLKKWAEDLAK